MTLVERIRARLPRRRPRDERGRRERRALPSLTPRREIVRGSAVVLGILALSLLLQLVFVSRLQHSASRQDRFDAFRGDLAIGTIPIGPTDRDDVELAPGTPIAFLEIPAIGVEEVIVEGTASGELLGGPGHRRDTPLPGQIGTSIVYGRRSTYGGPFSRLEDLNAGATITVTTGQGTFEYAVIGVRREGDPLPLALAPSSSRLELATADGTPFVPNGVVRVDADLVGDAVVGAARVVTEAELLPEELAMAGDTRTLWALALWLQALIGAAVVAIWAWHRWGRAQAWIVSLPPLLFIGLATAGEVARVLPNLA